MKTFLAVSLFLSSLNAYACPDLSGVYNYSPDGSITLTIAQQACSQVSFTIAVEGTVSTETDQINGAPQPQSDGTANTFQFSGNSLVVTPVDSTGAVIPGSDSTYTLTASNDMQYSLNIATDTAHPYNDVTIYQRVSR